MDLLFLSVILNVLQFILLVYLLFIKKSKSAPHLSTSIQDVPLSQLKQFIFNAPKTELHLHIESGTNPDLAFKIALRNNIVPGSPQWPWKTPADLEKALNFTDLESFLLIYYAVSGALMKEQDFIDQATNTVMALRNNNVRHAEIFFDPQSFTSRGIPFKTVADGFNKGLDIGRTQYGMSLRLIVSILRDSPVGTAMDEGNVNKGFANMDQATGWATIKQAIQYNKIGFMKPLWKLIGVGLDSNESPYPPSLFVDIYKIARDNDFLCTAHAGEEGPADYVWQAINLLKCCRIDHGVHAADDSSLCSYLATPQSTDQVIKAYGTSHKIPVTCCPMSNYRLKVFPDPTAINIGSMLNMGIMVSVSTDDPMYTASSDPYANEWSNASYELLIDNLMPGKAKAYPVTFADLKQLIVNGFESSWLDQASKDQYIAEVNAYFLTPPGLLYDFLQGTSTASIPKSYSRNWTNYSKNGARFLDN